MTTERRWIAALVIAFGLTRALSFAAGVRFDDSTLRYFFQFLDPELLRHELVRSVAHLHAQPPLFNLFLGTGLKTGPWAVPFFHLVFLVLGLVAVFAIFRTIVLLGGSTQWAGILALVFLAHPAAILYENHLFYTHPIACGLAVSGLFFRRFAATGAWRDGFLLFSILGALALMRPVFHLAWVVAVLALLVIGTTWRRRAIVAAAIPVLIVVAWYARTLVLFGTFGASTLLGMSVTKVTTLQGPVLERGGLIADGTLSRLAVVTPFRAFEYYEKSVGTPPPTGVNALDQRMKSTGKPNFNYLGYAAVSRVYLDDALVVLRQRPGWYWEGLRVSFRNSFRPPWGGEFVTENAGRIGPLTATYGVAHQARDLGAIVLTLGVLAASLLRLVTAVRRGTIRSPDHLTVAFLTGVVLWVTLVSNLLEIGENYRYRWPTFPVLFVLFGAAVSAATKRRSSAPHLPGDLLDSAHQPRGQKKQIHDADEPDDEADPDRHEGR